MKFRYSTIKCIKLTGHRSIPEEVAPFHERIVLWKGMLLVPCKMRLASVTHFQAGPRQHLHRLSGLGQGDFLTGKFLAMQRGCAVLAPVPRGTGCSAGEARNTSCKPRCWMHKKSDSTRNPTAGTAHCCFSLREDKFKLVDARGESEHFSGSPPSLLHN